MSRPFRKNYIATDVPIVPTRKNFLLANYSLQDSLVRRRFFPRKIPHCLPRAMLAVVARAIAFPRADLSAFCFRQELRQTTAHFSQPEKNHSATHRDESTSWQGARFRTVFVRRVA